MDHNSANAAEALAFIEQSRLRLAAASGVPPIRHAAFAALIGALVASPMAPGISRFVVLIGIFVALIAIIRWDRRRMGMFINGYRAGKTRWITFAMLGVILPLHMLGFWLMIDHGIRWAPLALALVASAIAYGGSVWWCRVFRRELLGSLA
ncbi:hypothetical protein DC429_02835 [Arthrobacter sp. TPD3018]|uniref:hypothetical protein n=1 Tax=Bacteria TaxID=2 RepID=UPI000D51F7E0|nr:MULTISPECIES: hypothetical protein [Bacteria]PVE59358.1 hypothetical protein DC425_02830 [Sphingomonas sp. TPD3009]PVE60878.1 hypothetical protein DC429_02835 [Arthrobacter sp. TPD3018]PVE87558.1 hypothetical protein DC431_02830 [Sphingomonas melonis]